MNPISQRLMGIGALLGFAVTFVSGAPVTMEGSFHLVVRAILGGFIFGMLALLIGEFVHRSVVFELEREVEMLLLEKERKKQDKLHQAAERSQAAIEGKGPESDFDLTSIGAEPLMEAADQGMEAE